MNKRPAGNEIQGAYAGEGPQFVLLDLGDALFQVFDRGKRAGIALLEDFLGSFFAQRLHVPKPDAHTQALGMLFESAVPAGTGDVDWLESKTMALCILY